MEKWRELFTAYSTPSSLGVVVTCLSCRTTCVWWDHLCSSPWGQRGCPQLATHSLHWSVTIAAGELSWPLSSWAESCETQDGHSGNLWLMIGLTQTPAGEASDWSHYVLYLCLLLTYQNSHLSSGPPSIRFKRSPPRESCACIVVELWTSYRILLFPNQSQSVSYVTPPSVGLGHKYDIWGGWGVLVEFL